MMQDLIHTDGHITLGASDIQHAEDLISLCKGWDKFHPYVGACLSHHLHDEQARTGELLHAIRREIAEDGGSVVQLSFTAEGTHLALDVSYG